MTDHTPTGIDRVVEKAGSHQAVADFCTVSRQAVAQWVHQGYAPKERRRALAAEYGVPAIDLMDPETRALAQGE